MEFVDVVSIARNFLWMSLLLITPVVVVSLAIGLVVSIGQTVTSIQEQTLSFAPRIVGVAFVMIVMMNWYLETLINYTRGMFIDMVGFVK